MTATQRQQYDPPAGRIDVRDAGSDGLFTLSAPVSSDVVARDGERFSEERLAGFRDQINSDQPVPLMVDHGKSEFGGDARYSVLGRIGTVDSAELERDGDTTLLRADMSVADPDALAEEGDTGEIEAALRWLRFQAETMGLSFSVGWSEGGGRADDVAGDAELLEVSAVATPSDVEASTASADPPETAVRGFEALPADSRDTHPPDDWGLRGYEPADPSDVERAEEALEALEHVREFHTPEPGSASYRQRDGTPPVLETLDELLRQFGHTPTTTSVGERLDELALDGRAAERQREDLLARLDTVEERAAALGAPQQEVHAFGTVNTHPFGRSRRESRERITDAVEALRDLLEDDVEVEGHGLAAYMEAHE